MGLGDLISNVLTSYKADVSDHVAALKKLKGEERERAKETIEHNEKVKSSLEDQIKSIAKVSAADRWHRWRVHGRPLGNEQLRRARQADIGRVRRQHRRLATATKGLKTEHELLADAARLNNGAFKLTTEQMAIAEQAMIQYTRRGTTTRRRTTRF
jgi:hypothetical protein